MKERLRMIKKNVEFWDLELNYSIFDSNSLPSYSDFKDVEWTIVVAENNLKQAFDFLWSLRAILWPSLIRNNLLEVRFIHEGSSGTGSGPFLFFGDTVAFKKIKTQEILENWQGIILDSGEFPHSDFFLSDFFDGLGFLGLDTLQIEFLYYEDLENEGDEELYERTFSADYRITSEKELTHNWESLSEPEQSQIASGIVKLADAQESEYGQYVQDITDLLVSIAVHPSTNEKLRRQIKERLVLKDIQLN